MIDIILAVQKINPDAQLSVKENDINQITWLNGTAVISKADIQAKQAELQTEYDAQEYARNRKAEYPTIADQLDKIYHDGIDSWKEEMILPVKNKFPKT